MKPLYFRWILVLVLSLQGCASSNHPQDPFEKVNRTIFAINRGVDKLCLKPIATIYNALLPQPIQTMVTNVFQNLGEISTFTSELLQGSYQKASQDYARFMINSTVGIGGLFDVATHHGLVKRRVDLGHTMAYWGYQSSAYVMLPLFGPSTVRDGIGKGIGYYLTVWPYIDSVRARNIGFSVGLIEARVRLLSTERIMKTVAIDEYAFVRDAYLQNRQYELDRLRQTSGQDVTLEEAPE